MSELFKYATELIQRQKLNAFTRTSASQLEKAIQDYQSGRGTRQNVERRLREFKRRAAEDMVQDLDRRGGVEQYGLSQQIGQTIERVLGGLGSIGRIAKDFIRAKPESWSNYTDQQLSAAAELLRRTYGREAVVMDPDNPQYKEGMTSVLRLLESRGIDVDKAIKQLQDKNVIGPDNTPFASQMEATEHVVHGKKHQHLSDFQSTPKSTNVYGFWYDYSNNGLYVQFQAHDIQAKSTYKSQGGMTGIAGDLGKTVGEKTGGPGQIYLYHKVPKEVFRRLISVKNEGGKTGERVQSPGTGVWTMLRIRGSIYGHQYNYSLVKGQDVKTPGGQDATYVSRRSTQRGFRSRSVTETGMGRRRYVSASLPEQLVPNDGRPKPVNRGSSGRRY